MSTFGLAEAKAKLSELVDRAEHGEVILLARHGRPVVKLVRIEPKRVDRSGFFGSLKGRMWIADDFDAPLPEDHVRAFEGHDDKGTTARYPIPTVF
jgi:prevent-host-death family protein